MNLIEVYNQSHGYSDKPIRIPHTFTSSVVVVRCSSVAAQISWHRAGWMTPVIDAPELDYEGISRRVYLKTKALRFESLGMPFQLDFNFVGWLSQAFITVWEPDPPIGTEIPIQVIQEKLDDLEANQRKTITFSLLDVEYSVTDGGLTISTFLIDIGYDLYEVGRFFRASDGVIVGDPLIDPSPGLLLATFTNPNRIEPGTLKVKIVVQGKTNA